MDRLVRKALAASKTFPSYFAKTRAISWASNLALASLRLRPIPIRFGVKMGDDQSQMLRSNQGAVRHHHAAADTVREFA